MRKSPLKPFSLWVYTILMKILLLTLICFFTQLSFAQDQKWVQNKDHSEILFQVPYLNVSEVTGRFNEFDATATFDEKKILPKEISVTISAASIDTGNKLRDGHLKGSEFFESGTYPHIIFTSKNITQLKPGEFRATGYMKIKKTTKQMTIDFSVTDSVKDTWGYENKFVKFKSKLNRKDFNINWNKTLDNEKYLVGDVITFWGVFQIQPDKAKTPMSKHMIPDTEYIRSREKKNRNNEEESSFSKKMRNLINGK